MSRIGAVQRTVGKIARPGEREPDTARVGALRSARSKWQHTREQISTTSRSTSPDQPGPFCYDGFARSCSRSRLVTRRSVSDPPRYTQLDTWGRDGHTPVVLRAEWCGTSTTVQGGIPTTMLLSLRMVSDSFLSRLRSKTRLPTKCALY